MRKRVAKRLKKHKLTEVGIRLLTAVSEIAGSAFAGRVHVSTHWDSERAQVCLAVADTGLGIAPEDQAHLFDRFYRGQHASQSNIPGTGLGLAIIKEIVDLHNGTIEVRSEVDVGYTFSVWLPVEKRDELSDVEDANGEKAAMA